MPHDPYGRCFKALIPVAVTIVGFQCQVALGGGGSPRRVIAAQIRSQGFACIKPKRATKDMRASKPLGAVWEIQCKNATYRVRLIPGMAAKVKRVDD